MSNTLPDTFQAMNLVYKLVQNYTDQESFYINFDMHAGFLNDALYIVGIMFYINLLHLFLTSFYTWIMKFIMPVISFIELGWGFVGHILAKCIISLKMFFPKFLTIHLHPA